jgi:Cys-tRNA(Pro)/Cys-tRNA(Cys) deacylase
VGWKGKSLHHTGQTRAEVAFTHGGVSKTASLEEYLRASNVWYRFISKEETIHTADAARVTGIPLARITKNLVAVTDGGEYVLLVVPGDRRVDLEKAARALGANSVRIVPLEEAEDVSGYPPGGTPTVGHIRRMRVTMDRSLLAYDTIFCGGGSRSRLLQLRTDDAVRLSGAIVADISEAPTAAS